MTLQTALASHPSDQSILDIELDKVQAGLRMANICISVSQVVDTRTLRELEAHGRALWNLCVRQRRDLTKELSTSYMKRLVLHSWLLAFLLFHMSRLGLATGRDSVAEAEYLLRLILTLTTASINDSEVGVAKLALQRGASFVNTLESAPSRQNCQCAKATQLRATYYSLRILLSWRENRLDVAEHMFRKLDPIQPDLDDSAVESLADVLQKVGTGLLSENNLELGVTWLKRAHHLLSTQIGIFSPKTKRLYLAVCNDIIKLALQSNLHEDIAEVENMLDHASSRVGDHPVLLHWKLMVLDTTEGHDCPGEARADIMRRMISSPELSETTLHLAPAHLAKVRDECSSELLDELLFRHALPSENAIMLGKVVYLRIWTALNISSSDDEHRKLGHIVENVYQSIQAPLSLAEVEACQAPVEEQRANEQFPTSELDWFHKNAYNIAILNCHEWEEGNVIRLASACISFVSCYPSTISALQADELVATLLRSHFLISVCLLKEARRLEDMPERHRCYAAIRHHTAEYRDILNGTTMPDVITHQDLAGKMTTLLVYDFEAAVSLRQFEDLEEITGIVKQHEDVQALKSLGDVLLQDPIPAQGNKPSRPQFFRFSKRSDKPVLTTTLRTIINEIHSLEQFNSAKFCKYLRVIFQATVSVNDTAALEIIGQIMQTARESRNAGASLPRTDLEWIAATTFNHGIDYYACSEDIRCKFWAAKAMELAEYLDDGGVMAKTLRDRFGQLRFENEKCSRTEG
ncbi:Meiosis specific protein SPO22 [Metarhizium album ARSEF 1941]|uniref:Meiosis specific protein SPO22 n=1 Tax=Metarhizium album (strain ARSEF 1941) TaxID=1081103 RepID=A0A0B2WWA9_METAS|nr:Meiosis specific protein SPO22 [Metarhizium album ARSEF 1941]KHN98328.1 Meiosis specific protein SPO22 [Metarhizium album ARSEF 1941]